MVNAEIGPNAQWLILPKTMRIHLVFHVSLLELYDDQPSEWPQPAIPQLIEVKGEEEWKVEAVLDSKLKGMG